MSGWLIFLLASAGHAEWWVIVVNRLHAFPIAAPKLRRFRSLHDLAVPGFPALLAAIAGFGEQGLLTGGTLTQLPIAIQVLLAGAVSGCIPLAFGILRWQCSGKHCFQLADSRDLLDLRSVESAGAGAASANIPAIYSVAGLHSTLAQIWPLNEFTKLEINRKSIRLLNPAPQSAAATARRTSRKTLRLLHFSDLHFIGTPGLAFYREFVRVAQQFPADAIFFTGDLIDDPQLLQQAVEILRPLTRIAPCWFILGNHDWRFDHERIRCTLEKSGWRCAAGSGQTIELNGSSVFIAGSERPWMGSPPPDATHVLADLRILLCHTPDGRKAAVRCGYQLMLSGHTHGGQVVLPFVGPVYSPSLAGVRFASGLFVQPEIVLHVSRGVGSKDPLRWNCPPELTCLEVTVEQPQP